MARYDYDVFVSHAREDKRHFARPLVRRLKALGLEVWFDEFSLRVGDSLRESIELGLSRSRYGIVIFSKSFFGKKWPKAELNGLFSREMEGRRKKTVILPVWYKVTSADFKKAGLPIQADRIALRSRDGVDGVARSLVERIKPELLKLDVRQKAASEAGQSFIEEARQKYPGYDFAVFSNAANLPHIPGTIASMISGNQRVDVLVSDRSLIKAPPGGSVTFRRSGIQKAIKLQRTGIPQTWETGEFKLQGWNVPLMPESVNRGVLKSGLRDSATAPKRAMRVEIGSPPPVVFPMLEMRLVRSGTHEAEFLTSGDGVPLQIRIVFPLKLKRTGTAKLRFVWDYASYNISECERLINALDRIRGGQPIRLIDIQMDKAIFEIYEPDWKKGDPVPPVIRRTVFLAAQIEREFSVSFVTPKLISAEDHESLFHLDCLLNGREYGKSEKTSFRMTKGEGNQGLAQEDFLRQKETILTVTQEPSDYPGYFPLFGSRVPTQPWVRVCEFVTAKEASQAELEAFQKAPIGTEFNFEIAPKGPVYLRWKVQ
jgi:hypothetical protein